MNFSPTERWLSCVYLWWLSQALRIVYSTSSSVWPNSRVWVWVCALGTHCSSNSVVFLECETKLKPIYYRRVRARSTLLPIAVCVWLAFWNMFRMLSSRQTMACYAQFRMHNGCSVENSHWQPCVERHWSTSACTLTEFVGSIHRPNKCVCSNVSCARNKAPLGLIN